MGGVRGVGLQKYGAVINVFGYVCIATPCILVLIFVAKMGVMGFWIGIGIGLFVQIVLFNVLLFKSDWNKLSKQAKKRAGVFQESAPFDLEGDEVEVKNNFEEDDIILEDKTDVASPCSKQEIEQFSDDCSENRSVKRKREPRENLFAAKNEKPANVSILPKLIFIVIFIAIFVSSIFIRIFI